VVGVVFAVMALGAGAAQAAARFVFDIQVTQGYGMTGPFVPFSFQQVWTFTPEPVTTVVTGDPPGFTQRTMTDAAFTPSPLTAGVLATLGMVDDGSAAMAVGRNRTTLDGATPIVTNGSASFSRFMESNVDLGDGTTRSKFYSYSLSGFGELAAIQAGIMDAEGFAQLLEALGPLQFTEAGDHSIVDQATLAYHQQATVTYNGTATFNRAESAIPEPQAWLLMLLGFGALGATVRARRLA
jgi:hypothetical protein